MKVDLDILKKISNTIIFITTSEFHRYEEIRIDLRTTESTENLPS